MIKQQILIATFALLTAAGAASAQSRVVGYYYGPTVQRGFSVADVKGDLLTHLIYAFGEVRADGTVAIDNPSFDTTNFAALRVLKQQNPRLQVLMAFGGWSGSKFMSDAASTPENRARFAQTFIDKFLRAYPGVFDGIDVDWEYPGGGGDPNNTKRPEDKQNLTLLVKELRAQLDAFAADSKKHYAITIAGPAGPNQIAKFEMKELSALLDFIDVMGYDYHSGGRTSHFNAPLDTTRNDPSPNLTIKKTVAAYRAAGIAPDKLVLGVPFYGYRYVGVAANDNGRLQPVDSSGSVASIRYKTIGETTREDFYRYWDASAQVPWLWNPKTRTFITYDDAQSLAAKAAYVKKQKLGGIMIWELSGDDGTLLPAISKALTLP